MGNVNSQALVSLGVGEVALSAQRHPSDSQRFNLLTRDGIGAPSRQRGCRHDMMAPDFAISVGEIS